MPDDKKDIESVELDATVVDTIADAVAAKMTDKSHAPEKPEPEEKPDPMKGLDYDRLADLIAARVTPKRTETEEAGVKAKPGEAVYTGGDDMYTFAGDDDAERASNLYLTQTVLKSVGKDLSPRARQVMLAAGEKALKSAPDPIQTPGSTFDGNRFVKSEYGWFRSEAYKAMTSTGSNAGDEWVPTFSTSELWRDIHLATNVAAAVRRVPMPTNPYDLPTETADATFYYASSENTAVTASNPTTDKATLTAKKIQAEIDFSGELTEDSIIPIVPTLRSGLVRKAAQAIDDLIVHGDTETGGTGNVNTDNTAAAAGSFYLALDGMRKFCLVTNTAQVKQFAGAPTTTLYLNTRSLLGKYGARASDLRIITGFSTQNSFADVAGFKLVSEYGPQAAVVQGEVGRIYGTPVLLSEAIPGATTDKVDDDGKYTTTSVSTNDTDGWFVLVNPYHWVTGFRREVNLESFRDIQKDQNILVCSFRMALIPSGIATSHTAVGYDITVL